MRGVKFDREFLVNKVALMRIKGKSTHSILEFLVAIPMSRKIAYEILADAQKVIVEEQKKDLNEAIADSLAKLEELYMTSENNITRLQVLKEYNRLKGMYVDKVDITSGGEKIKGISFEIIEKSNDDNGTET